MENIVPEKPKILYVDDTETNLILFEHNFIDEYEIHLADSGKKGLELLHQHKFTILITDQRMPGMSGNELLEIATIKFPDVMRFLLTAYSDYETLVEAINKGQIYGFFNKPFKAQEVRMVLRKATEVYYLREKNREMLKELELANKELRAIDQSKTRFLSTITEEIKSPINKITSAIHMLKDKIDSKDLTDLLNFLDSSIMRLENFSSLANQLAQLREGENKLDFTDVSLKELVEVCFIEKNIDLKEKGITVTLDKKEEGLKVKGDYELLLTCLSIIILNSIKHSDKNGVVLITLNREDSQTSVTVTDEGKNYTSLQIDNMISLFATKVKSLDSDAGLELVLARQIMEAHGGSISIETLEDKKVSVKMKFT